MFKYISTILKTFTPAQRILALLLLLFFITVIMVGPAMINSFKTNNDELIIRITSQNKQIKELTIRVDELNKQVIDNQRECTNQILEKEREIVLAVSSIINEEERISRPLNRFESSKGSGNGSSGSKPIMETTASYSSNRKEIIKVEDNSRMLSKLKKLKNRYERDINN